MTRRFVAPGKVVVVGEYAVIEGAPAIVAAIDHGVTCDVDDAAARDWTVPAGDDRFVRAALVAVGAPAARYAFRDSVPAVDPTQKPGFGGSAAATVVAAFAGSALAGAPLVGDALHQRAAAVHHAVQGSGSGVDVAASALGGVLWFEAGRARPVPPVPLVVVWSGQEARTGPRVAAWRALAGPSRDAFVRQSAALADLFVTDPRAALTEGYRLLDRMTQEAGIAWRTDAHARIAELAQRFGGAAKPSGAGGGDCAVAWLPDPDATAAFTRAISDEPPLAVVPAAVAPAPYEVPARPSGPR